MVSLGSPRDISGWPVSATWSVNPLVECSSGCRLAEQMPSNKKLQITLSASVETMTICTLTSVDPWRPHPEPNDCLEGMPLGEGRLGRTVQLVALFATSVKGCSASRVIWVFVIYLIEKHDLLRVLTRLDGAVVVFDITNPCLKEAFSLEVRGGQHPHEFTEEHSLLSPSATLAHLAPMFPSLSSIFPGGAYTSSLSLPPSIHPLRDARSSSPGRKWKMWTTSTLGPG
ncbi:hypothetical protein Cgig2_012722 [Carnegiea gigantea]|uniref:Uncharacterized protein n=1 Tax=Carnegiea gigantea TaxID=171969 RepID=A0A9Q1GJP5_9CARY|nr:hypothetical protein Cgig2_012722 [Carnegiea gigantea]